MTGNPTVSVLMAAFNAEQHLREAVESILGQTYQDFEFVIVNDGSVDNTSAILQQYAEHDDRIVLIEQENHGQQRALNVGFAACRGQLIARMDADDVCLPQRLQKQVEFLETHPECIVLGTALELIDFDGDPLGHQVPPLTHDEIESQLLGGIGAVPHPTAMIRRNFLARVQGYDETAIHVEDLDLWLKLSEIGRLANLPDELLQYRLHENSITGGKRREQIESAERVIKNAARRRGIEVELDAILKNEIAQLDQGEINHNRQKIGIAVESGNYATAAKYAWRQIKQSPFSIRRWKTWLSLSMGKRPSRI